MDAARFSFGCKGGQEKFFQKHKRKSKRLDKIEMSFSGETENGKLEETETRFKKLNL
jgi:hypothetical protein